MPFAFVLEATMTRELGGQGPRGDHWHAAFLDLVRQADPRLSEERIDATVVDDCAKLLIVKDGRIRYNDTGIELLARVGMPMQKGVDIAQIYHYDADLAIDVGKQLLEMLESTIERDFEGDEVGETPYLIGRVRHGVDFEPWDRDEQCFKASERA
jgi:hypothetical protein